MNTWLNHSLDVHERCERLTARDGQASERSRASFRDSAGFDWLSVDFAGRHRIEDPENRTVTMTCNTPWTSLEHHGKLKWSG